jgi:nicotinamidase-related amidase
MLMDRQNSTLLVVDVQERLLPAIADGEAVLANGVWLVGVARRLGVPVVISEQYPEGLGRTAGPLLAAAEGCVDCHQDAFFLCFGRLPRRHVGGDASAGGGGRHRGPCVRASDGA